MDVAELVSALKAERDKAERRFLEARSPYSWAPFRKEVVELEITLARIQCILDKSLGSTSSCASES